MDRHARTLYRLPVFRSPRVDQPRGQRLVAGDYPLLSLFTDREDNGWMQLGGDGGGNWIVARSAGHAYAIEAVASNDPWALLRTRQADPRVKATIDEALAMIPATAAPHRRAACTWMANTIGMDESPPGSNSGPILGPVAVLPYHQVAGIPGDGGLAWCAILASLAQFHGLGLGDPSSRADWKRHPLGTWAGAAWQAEQLAVKEGLWVPARDIPGTSPLEVPGSLAVMARAGSGSDAGARTGARYAGHVDLAFALVGNRVKGVGGNLSDRVKLVDRPASSLRGLVLLPAPG